jgi:hypothetical protein
VRKLRCRNHGDPVSRVLHQTTTNDHLRGSVAAEDTLAAIDEGIRDAEAGRVLPGEQARGLYGAVTVLLSKATAPLRAKALPVRVAPVFSVIDSRLRMVPWKIELVPRVAEVETCQ